MKKIFLITLLLYISLTTNTYATGACPIQNKAAGDLLEYIKNNKTVIKNITNSIIKNKKSKTKTKKKGFLKTQTYQITTSLSNAKNETVSIFNEIFNFDGYYSYFRYYVTYPIFNEIPYQIRRDYEILNNENKGLLEYIKNIDRKGFTEIKVEDPCKGVKNKCELNGLKAKEIVGKLIQNNERILNLFRLTVMGQSSEFKDESKLFLVSNNFKENIKKHYSPLAAKLCSKEGGFFEQIYTAIKEIRFLNEKGEKAKRKWIDAWDLLMGNKPDEEKKKEKELLENYLSDIGISSENHKTILQSLHRYEQEGLSLNNNFLSNTISNIKDKTRKETKKWVDKYSKEFFDTKYKKTLEQNKYIAIEEIQNKEDQVKKTIEIKTKISELYNKELPFAAVGDISTVNLRGKIIETHINLSQSIKTLVETCPIAVEICEKQGGGGNCGKCN